MPKTISEERLRELEEALKSQVCNNCGGVSRRRDEGFLKTCFQCNDGIVPGSPKATVDELRALIAAYREQQADIAKFKNPRRWEPTITLDELDETPMESEENDAERTTHDHA